MMPYIQIGRLYVHLVTDSPAPDTPVADDLERERLHQEGYQGHKSMRQRDAALR